MFNMRPELHIKNSQTGEESDFRLTTLETHIGRSPDNDLVLPDDEVSRRHAAIRLEDDSHVLVDLESANGTRVNGESIKEKTLSDEDTISIGPYVIVYHLGLHTTVRYEERKLGDSLMIRTPDQLFPAPPETPPVSLASSTESLLSEIETLREKAEILARIYELNRTLSSALSIEDIFEELGQMIFRLTPADRFFALLSDPKTGRLELSASKFRRQTDLPQGEPLSISKTVLETVLRDRVTLLSADTQVDKRLALASSLVMQKVHSIICAPLVRENQMLGAIYVDCYDLAGRFTTGHLDLMNALAASASLVVDNTMSHEQLLRESLARAGYSRFLPRHVVDEILANPESLDASGANQVVTVLFADLRGFTALAEGLAPPAVVQILNKFFGEMTPIIFERRGVLDKYMGDGLMALFGVPQPDSSSAWRAVSSAIEMQRHMTRLNEALGKEGLPEIAVGIGINTGEVTVGYVGSEHRMDYTAVGDAVNLASRLEKRAGPGQILITASTLKASELPLPVEPAAEITIKGKSAPVQVYEVVWPSLAGDPELTRVPKE
jgi:adenylate cyclase